MKEMQQNLSTNVRAHMSNIIFIHCCQNAFLNGYQFSNMRGETTIQHTALCEDDMYITISSNYANTKIFSHCRINWFRCIHRLQHTKMKKSK